MLKDKTLIWLLTLYMIFQLASLFLGVELFFFVYIILYLAAIIYAATRISKSFKKNISFKPLLLTLASFFIVNLILFLIYIPTLLNNPSINWKLKGEVEQDPMILLAYFPPILFVIALIGLLLTALATKLISNGKTRMRTT